jgi:regulator of sirC expression with transglutaminase-like and TPR domain
MLNKININHQRQILIVYVVLAVVILVVFWQVNQYDFVSDDFQYVAAAQVEVRNGITLDAFRWAFSTKYIGLWNPLIWLSFMFDYKLFGLNAGGYHVTNLILHIFSTLLLFWLFNRMTGAIWRSAFVAALFALHPLHVESVAWIAERKDTLSAFFWMLTLCLYVHYTEKPVIRKYLPVLLCFACALMSKPMVITLPIVMILLDYWPLDRLQSQKIVTNMPEVMSVSTNKGKKKNKFKKEALKKNISPPRVQKLSEPRIGGIIPLWQLWEKIPFFILSIVFVIITLYHPSTNYNILDAPPHPNTNYNILDAPPHLNTHDMSDAPTLYIKQFPLISRIANAPVAFVTYLEKTFWPHDMAIFYPFSDQIPLWQVLGASLLIIVISVAVIVMVKRLPYLFTGWMWSAITIAPVIGIIQISMTTPYTMADRYHYLPSIGIGIMLAWGVPDLLKKWNYRKEILLTLSALIILFLSIIAWTQVGYWKNSMTLFSHTLKVTGYNNRLAYNNRGNVYNDLGNYKQAIEDYSRAIEISPEAAEGYYNRGIAYKNLGNYKQAIEDYSRAIEISPKFSMANYNRAIAYYGFGNHKQAIEDLNRVIEINPRLAEAYISRSNSYNGLGNHKQAIEDLNRAIEINPRLAEAYLNRGVTYNMLGNEKLASEDLKTAAILGNEHAKNLLKRQGINW